MLDVPAKTAGTLQLRVPHPDGGRRLYGLDEVVEVFLLHGHVHSLQGLLPEKLADQQLGLFHLLLRFGGCVSVVTFRWLRFGGCVSVVTF